MRPTCLFLSFWLACVAGTTAAQPEGGRFESLGIVFPKDFSSAQFVLAALGQWQFRPALQNSQPVKVEVLLIIPETFE